MSINLIPMTPANVRFGLQNPAESPFVQRIIETWVEKIKDSSGIAAYDYLTVSQIESRLFLGERLPHLAPVLKVMQERGMLEYKRVDRSLRYRLSPATVIKHEIAAPAS